MTWDEAQMAACVLALAPAATGAVLRAPAGPVRDRWLALLRGLLPAGAPWRRMPAGIGDERLLGGLDLAATLAAGRAVAQRGLLAETDGGVLLLPMAERLEAGTAARLGLAQDRGAPRLGLVALDEGVGADERAPAGLCDRLALWLDLTAIGPREIDTPAPDAAEIAGARRRLPTVSADDIVIEALCAAALALGVFSLRAPLLALSVARAAAALGGRAAVGPDDAAMAARLVLAPRATLLPQAAPPPDAPEPPEPPPPDSADDTERAEKTGQLDDRVLEAATAAIPGGLLAALAAGLAPPRRGTDAGRKQAAQPGGQRGRPAGTRRGTPGWDGRLSVVETLRAAAPWQRLRSPAPGARVAVRQDDLRVVRVHRRQGTTTIFAVDASGSQALHRLAEVKGAVELLLADCYLRRDQVALLAFRGRGAELLLPPTRALARARRSLAGLPGGGGTPLAAGIDAAAALADQVRRRGGLPVLVILTDGRANIARDGAPGRPRAEQDALAAATRLHAEGATVLLVDTGPTPQPAARRLAEAMAARYLPLPRADAAALSRAVRADG